jgi:hypothetical protein
MRIGHQRAKTGRLAIRHIDKGAERIVWRLLRALNGGAGAHAETLPGAIGVNDSDVMGDFEPDKFEDSGRIKLPSS